MTKSDQDPPLTEDIDIRALGRALWRAKGWILGLAVGAGAVTFIVLSMLRPLYTSEARILIQDDDSTVTQRVLDEQAVQSQVQAITSRDLAVQVIKALDLTNNPAFAKDAGMSAIGGFLRSLGLGRGSERSEEEKAVDTFAEHLSVFPLDKSSVVAVDYTSGDTGLAAQIANKLADVYIAWQREAALEQTKDATAWLNAQIEVLRPKVAEAEAAVEQFKASGLSGTEIKLRALEGEAKAERDLLESYLARYRDASARHDMGAVPAQAAIVSRAHASILPSFPKPGPINLLVAVVHRSALAHFVLPRATARLTGSAAPGDPANDARPAAHRRAQADVGDVEVDDLVRHVLDGEALRHDLLQRGGALKEGLRAGEKGAQLTGERRHVSGRDQRHVDARHDLGDAADIGGDQRHLRSGGLEHDVRKRFRPRRHYDAPSARESAPRGLCARERDSAV